MSPQLCCLAANLNEAHEFDAPLVFDSALGAAALGQLAGVVLPVGTEARAAALLEQGAVRVYVGDAALADGGVVTRLAQRFGSARVGVHVHARRLASHWSFETVSNADFRVVTPSVCEPAWEVLRCDGSPGAPRAHGWIDQMVRRGAGSVLLQADIADDADLNLCAGLVESLGDAVCFAPAADLEPRLYEWVRWGQARRIALPPALFRRREALLLPADTEEAL